jgi:glycosyltransferase involved in cell wall biosynthesis
MNPKFIADYQNNTEKTIACKSVFCIATSEYLKNKLLQYNKNVFEIRLGAPEVDNIKINTTIPKREKIHVGFVGFLQTADIQLLNNIMDHEEFLITIIGPVEKKETGRLAHYNNIQYTGKLTGQTLYDEINKLDVGIIPYSLSSKIDRTPNKLWLYLAVGKPSVITNISGIKNWRFPEKFVYKANSEDEFSKLIKKAHAENNPSLIEKRIQFARNNTWGNRMDQLIKILGTFQLDKI